MIVLQDLSVGRHADSHQAEREIEVTTKRIFSPVEPGFSGSVALTVEHSRPWWPDRRSAQNSPNVVVVVLDDVGFSQLGCYGGSIDTPSIDRLADSGLRYTNFHVTALCSPTRACLLTGRNNHQVGMGFLADFDTGFPSYRGEITPRAATMAEVLQAAGYATYALGKWRLMPPRGMSASGPFDSWPTHRGFDRFYGFLGGEEDQWSPQLWHDQHQADPPLADSYHLSADLVDRAQEYLRDHLTATPDRPFFLYLAFGAGHAPHQVPRPYIDRYQERYEHGWDEERERVLARQIEMGVVPEGTRLAPRNPDVEAWSALSADRRRLYARMQEVFAAFLSHADEQAGRLVDFLHTHDIEHNTIVLVLSDNGASGEGGPHGTVNEYRYFLGLPDSWEEALARIDELGGPGTHNHYPSGWAQAGNTPLKFYKKHTFGGGVRAPLIIRWPRGLGSDTGLRTQFHHVIDVMPTLLELAGTEAPQTYRGIEQLPIHGISMAYTFREAGATSRRREQYFETAGHRGIYVDGYKAVTLHEPGTPYEKERWQLYDLEADFSETEDLAERRPDLVQSMVARWWEAAESYGVLPLDDRMQERAETLDPQTEERLQYTLFPGTRLMNPVVGPNFSGRGFRLSARVERSDQSEEGVLLAYGRRAAGFSLFVQRERLVFDFNLAGDHTLVESDRAVPVGPSLLEFQLSAGKGGSAHAELWIDGSITGKAELPMVFPAGLGTLSTQCGHNSPSPVSLRYQSPFAFSGHLLEVTVVLDQEKASTAATDWKTALGQE